MDFFEEYFPLIIIGIGIIIIFGAYYFLWELPRQRRRSASLERAAAQMGFSFQEQTKAAPRELFGSLPLFDMPGPEVMKNVIKGEFSEKVSLHLFDHELLVHEDRNVLYTVAAFHLQGTRLPTFALHAKLKERVSIQAFRRIGLKVRGYLSGFQKIDFPHHGLFAGSYQLRSPEPGENIHRLFDDSMLSFFANNPGWHVEGKDDWLIVYQYDKLVKPQNLHTFITQCREIMDLFSHGR